MALRIVSPGSHGLTCPLRTLQALLASYGLRKTLRAIAVALVLLTSLTIPLLKGRLPSTERSDMPKVSWISPGTLSFGSTPR
jgi:predicted benzoate:H+ symporter BenE